MPFHPVIVLPPNPDLLDLSSASGVTRTRNSAFSIGRYNENRIIYTQDLFAGDRSIHMGIDLGAPAGTPVHAFADGTIYCLGVNPADGDYGPTIVTEHVVNGRPIWALHGHLSASSLDDKIPSQTIHKGQVIGWLGNESENGGWPPHVHFQLSWNAPITHDMPGAVSEAQHSQALLDYPDPRIVLGPIY